MPPDQRFNQRSQDLWRLQHRRAFGRALRADHSDPVDEDHLGSRDSLCSQYAEKRAHFVLARTADRKCESEAPWVTGHIGAFIEGPKAAWKPRRPKSDCNFSNSPDAAWQCEQLVTMNASRTTSPR